MPMKWSPIFCRRSKLDIQNVQNCFMQTCNVDYRKLLHQCITEDSEALLMKMICLSLLLLFHQLIRKVHKWSSSTSWEFCLEVQAHSLLEDQEKECIQDAQNTYSTRFLQSKKHLTLTNITRISVCLVLLLGVLNNKYS